MERLQSAGFFIAAPFYGAYKLTVGTLQAATALISGGRWCEEQANDNLDSAGITFQAMHLFLIGVVNPDAKINQSKFKSNGFATEFIFNHLDYARVSIFDNENRFISQVGTRAFSLFVYMPAMLLSRLIDGVIAVPLTIASCVTFGKYELINNWAQENLSFLQLVHDLYESLNVVVDPRNCKYN